VRVREYEYYLLPIYAPLPVAGPYLYSYTPTRAHARATRYPRARPNTQHGHTRPAHRTQPKSLVRKSIRRVGWWARDANHTARIRIHLIIYISDIIDPTHPPPISIWKLKTRGGEIMRPTHRLTNLEHIVKRLIASEADVARGWPEAAIAPASRADPTRGATW